MVTTALRVVDYGTNALLIGVAFSMVGAWLLRSTCRPERLSCSAAGPDGQGFSLDSASS
jgi:hypothetical protein